jgi:hypothetical protein
MHELPSTRPSVTRRIDIDNWQLYITIGFDEQLKPREVFIVVAKQGSTVRGLLDGLGYTISKALQWDVPWPVLRDHFIGHRFEPCNEQYASILDAIGKEMDDVIQTCMVNSLLEENDNFIKACNKTNNTNL